MSATAQLVTFELGLEQQSVNNLDRMQHVCLKKLLC